MIYFYRNDVSNSSYSVLWWTRIKINMPPHTNVNRVSLTGRCARLFISRESDLNAIRCWINGSYICMLREHKSWRLVENITIMRFITFRILQNSLLIIADILPKYLHLYLLQENLKSINTRFIRNKSVQTCFYK